MVRLLIVFGILGVGNLFSLELLPDFKFERPHSSAMFLLLPTSRRHAIASVRVKEKQIYLDSSWSSNMRRETMI